MSSPPVPAANILSFINCDKPIVERYNRTYEEEAIRVYLPTTFLETQEMNHDQKYHYNHKRPNQAKSCGNLPPCVAFPNLSPLPALPQQIDPNCWLDSLHGKLFKRRVDATGTVHLDKHRYYIGRNRHKQTVVLQIDAPQRQVNALVDGQVIKTFPLKGVDQAVMSFEAYLTFIRAEAVSQWRQYVAKARRYVRLVD